MFQMSGGPSEALGAGGPNVTLSAADGVLQEGVPSGGSSRVVNCEVSVLVTKSLLSSSRGK